MPGNERLVVSIGIGLALFFTLGLGMVMCGLRYSVPDRGASSAKSIVIGPDFPRHLIDFSLIDQSGQAVSRKDLAGKIVVVNFVFTSCSLVCPYVNTQMKKIQQLTAGQSDIRLISLTLDPVDDTAPVLTKYGQNFGQNPSRRSFLTGDEVMMRTLVGTSFLSRDTSGQFAYMPGNFANTQRIVLIDAKGRVVEYFDGLGEGVANVVVSEIRKLKASSS